jgi:DNA-binding SARP family transcriptional activator/DNA-binding beta-propeller fold protein YncE
MEFRILGPLEVLDEGKPVALGTLKERLVLAVLLLHANEFVSRERLIDELWGESPPPTARKAVNVYISKLRHTLTRDGHDPIATASGGYRLQVDEADFDAARMQQLLDDARAAVSKGELEDAATRFREALALWRGATLAGLQPESRGRDEVAQLDELRLTALMDRIDCDLALGQHEHALVQLNVLVREHPLRERLRAQQMLALYRADRQVEALEAFAETRRTLVDDLGIEPSEALQRLQQAILRHDPSLETPEGTAALNGLEPIRAAAPVPTRDTDAGVGDDGSPRRFRSRRWRLALAGAALLAASAAAAAILADSAGGTPRIVPNSLVQLDPRTGKPVLVREVGVEPEPIAITPTAIWTVDDSEVSRLDLHTHEVDTSPVTSHQGSPFDIAFDKEGNAWVTSSSESPYPPPVNAFVTRISRGPGVTQPGVIDPGQVGLLQSLTLPLGMAGDEVVGAGRLWVIVGPHGPDVQGETRVVVLDFRTSQLNTLPLGEHATAIAYGDDTVWIGTYGGGGGGEPDDSRLEAIRAGHSNVLHTVLEKHGADWGPLSIAVGDQAVWVVTYSTRQLFKINPITLQIEHRLDLSAEQPGSVTVGAGAVWVTGAHSVIKIDPRTDTALHTYPINTGYPCAIAATSTTLWLAVDGRPC